MKKKSLLLAIAAMSMAAVGVGTVGTFAWFTAQTAVNVSATNVANQLTTASTSVSIDSVGVTFTISTKGDGVELHHVATASGSDSDSTSYASGDILVGGMANGLDLRQYKWLGDNKAHRVIGEYQAVASWTSSAPVAGRLEALKGKSYQFELSAAGNAKILTETNELTLTAAGETQLTSDQKAANLTAAKNVVDGNSTHAYVTISFGDDFNGTISNATVTLSNPYYTIKTNNPAGLEWDAENDTSEEHTTEYHTLDKISVEEAAHSAQ